MKQPTSIIVQLIHIHGPLKGEIQEFSGNEIIIGRHASCDLQFPRDLVAISRKHASIIRDGNRFKVVDQSTNGTFLNGERITEDYLKNGDVIFFTEGGPKVSFLTRVGEITASPEPAPISSPEPPAVQSVPSPEPQVQNSANPIPQPEPVQQPEPIPQPVYQQAPVSQPQSPPVQQSEIKIETIKAPLIVQYGPILQSFNELPVTIGAHPECNLTIDHPSLLEQHIQIFFSQGSYRVKDLTGRNQILINNQPIQSPAALIPGDKIFLTSAGPAFHFMEGGRMAEINIQPTEPSENSETAEPIEKKEFSDKKKGSMFKRFFR